MNILRWRRKSKKKIKLKTILLFSFSLIMTTFAWFAYSKVLEPSLDLHVLSWDMVYKIGETEYENPIGISIPTLYPAMPEEVITIDIYNNGETVTAIEHFVQSISILGENYALIKEGQTLPATGNYIQLTDAFLETNPTTGEQIVRGAITNDITKLPFTIDIEHSAKVIPKTTTTRLDTETGQVVEELTGGKGYLTVRVNWVGDNHELDTKWGYLVGQYFANNPSATSAISIGLLVDSYQLEPEFDQVTGELITDVKQTVVMPSTAETKPYLPTGFTRVAGTTLKNGLVIKDASGNEYVWIEVPKSEAVYGAGNLNITTFSDAEYTTIENALKSYSANYRTRSDSYTSNSAIGLTDEQYETLKKKMLKSIYQNGGFYIGRYETGIIGSFRTRFVATTEETPVIQANAYPYNYVSCGQAQTLASNMESGSHTSSLMFGLQWDLVLKYLEVKGAATEDELKVDSTTIGNYYKNTYYALKAQSKYSLDNATTWPATPYEKYTESAVALTTGGNSLFSKQNIYDIAGNMAEWTLNVTMNGSTPIGGNGGNYSDTTNHIANYCGTFDTTSGTNNVGFRVTIY